MPGPHYFAWVGGTNVPAFDLQTTADIWGGSLQTQGDTWGGLFQTTGDLLVTSTTVSNVADTLPLVPGTSYFIQGPGILDNPDGSPATTFTFDGSDSFTLSNAVVGVVGAGMAGASLRISSNAARTTVAGLTRTDGLEIGTAYAVAGAGIAPGTTTTYGGGDTLTLSQPATATAWRGSLTLSNPAGRNIVRLADTTGLVTGQVYQLFAPGVPPGNFFTHDGTANAALTVEAGETRSGAPVAIHKGITEDDGGDFNPAVHNVEDEAIFALEIVHEEGQCPTLQLDIANPFVGLLAAGRKQWCWLSWFDGTAIQPLFHGRLVGVPQRIESQVVRLNFVAKPGDFDAQKAVLAASLRVLPYFDPLFLQQRLYDPDTVLEAYSALWHVDRTSLTVSTSDLITPEDGTVAIDDGQHFWDELAVSYRQSPLSLLNVSLTVTWKQSAEGEVDLTDALVKEFQAQGSPFEAPLFGSFTSQGLVQAWPKPGQPIGAGWSMSPDSTVALASFNAAAAYQLSYIDAEDTAATLTNQQAFGAAPLGELGSQTMTQWDVAFPIYPIVADFIVHFDAARDRSEELLFTLVADVQPLMTDPGGQPGEALALSSQSLTEPIDDGGLMPLGDTRRNAYFTTERGLLSIEYGLLLARARLRARARAVEIKCGIGWPLAVASDLSLRKAAQISDARLPGGLAIGKLIHYRISADGDHGGETAELTLACAIGNGASLGAPAAPTDAYAVDYAVGYTAVAAQLSLVDGELVYVPPDPAMVDDDGVDLFHMTPDSVLLDLRVLNGPSGQKHNLDTAIAGPAGVQLPDPIAALKRSPTELTVDLVPVVGGAFRTAYMVATEKLMIPKQIDLAAT